MKTIKKIPSKTMKFVIRHKTAAAVVVTAMIGVMINRSALAEFEDFLADKGLMEEYVNRFNRW